MSVPEEVFEHQPTSLAEVSALLQRHEVDLAVLKVLPKNANDKNQVFVASSFTDLHKLFDMRLSERGPTASRKSAAKQGSNIPEAVFTSFEWLKPDGTRHKAKNVKVIVYTQYPEARLSGFLTTANTMPRSLSVAFTKAHPQARRLLVLGRLPGGACLAMVCIDFSDAFLDEIRALASLGRGKVCKLLRIQQNFSQKLLDQLAGIVGKPLRGCKLNKAGDTRPFTGTQVCGYTLEHALGIVPNSSKDGDLYGIELKTHTKPKTTLFTPEPDFGLYAADFGQFMRTYGYLSADGTEYRVTGIHKANVRCSKSKLTLHVREYRVDSRGELAPFPYDPQTSLTKKLGAVEVVLLDDSGNVAAGWTLERLMNNWGAKHNKAVYISAKKEENPNAADFAAGYTVQVIYSPEVIFCEGTSAERLLNAISGGLIYLDPGPKLVPLKPADNKRRSQWRVANIETAVADLYDTVRHISLEAV